MSLKIPTTIPHQELKAKFFRGSLTGSIRVALAIPVYLVLTPFMLSRLGAELFAIWSFGSIIINVLTLSDFGFKNSLVVFTAKNLEDRSAITDYFSGTLITYLALVCVLFLVIWLVGPATLGNLVGIPRTYWDEGYFVLVITTLSFGMRFLAMPWQAVIEGFQEYWFSQLVQIAWLLLNFVLSMLALAYEPTIYALGIATLLSGLVVNLSFQWYARKRLPFLRFRLSTRMLRRLKELYGYGAGIQLAGLFIVLRDPLLKIIIAKSSGLALVAAYEISFRLCTQLISLTMAPSGPTFAASALFRDRFDELAEFLKPIVNFTVCALLAVALVTWVAAPELLGYWLGGRAPEAITLFPLMCLAFCIYYATELQYKTIVALGHSFYSAGLQSLVLGTLATTVLINETRSAQAVGIGFLTAFGGFTLCNLLAFRIIVGKIQLITVKQLTFLSVPTMTTVVLWQWLPADSWIALIVLYLALHLWTSSRLGLLWIPRVLRRPETASVKSER